MNNNETVAVQLERAKPTNLKCNRSSEKYEIRWRKVEKRKKCFNNLVILNSITFRMESHTSESSSPSQTLLFCP